MTEANAPRHLIAGNWKMNGIRGALEEAVKVRDALTAGAAGTGVADVMLCPPATLVMVLAEVAKGSRLAVGGQDCHANASGAHTGDIAAEMLKDAGATSVIVGHSERRADHGETDAVVCAKAHAAHRAGLTAIVCVGETAGERAAGLTLTVVQRQLMRSLPDASTPENTVVAYEPVWAIGTGLTATATDVAEVHAMMRAELLKRFGPAGSGFRLLYGGSVKPSNAAELMAVANVNGALVGGASLKAQDFLGIVAGCPSRAAAAATA